jgi:RND family efflux transporter MFP subunit
MRAAKVLAPVAIVGAGILGAAILIATRPAVDTTTPEPLAPLLRVIEVTPDQLTLTVTTHGSVAPRTESDLVPEVSGRVVWISPALVSGGFFEAGGPLLRLDSRDYEIAQARARANLERASSELDRARRELARQRDLAKRQVASASQLDDAEKAERVATAVQDEAAAALQQAENDLARTTLLAPFTGRVREVRVDVGQFVARGAAIAKLYAIDFAEVRLPIADDELRFLDLPLFHRGEPAAGTGPEVVLKARFAGEEHTWTGRVVRTEGEIDPQSRMIHVVARVEDPYGRAAAGDGAPLAVGLFVEAEIQGRALDDVALVPRGALRGDDRLVVVDAEDRLRLRPVRIVRAGRRDVVIAGESLHPGDRVVVSPTEIAVDGMPVRPLVVQPNGTGDNRKGGA